MSEAISVDEHGPKIRPELMEPEKIYHCIYNDTLLLFFVDEQKFLSCYEIDEPALVEAARNGGGEIEGVLQEYARSARSGGEPQT